MKILQVHNFYSLPGGEDVVFAAEAALLTQYGHQVATYQEHNDRIHRLNPVRAAARTIWSSESRSRILDALERERPAVCHFHNTFPLISPSAYYACRASGVPVVQTLHNYRLMCPASTLFRDNAPCEDCVEKSAPWPGVLHACYRGSRSASAAVAAMLTTHRMLGTWRERVSTYIALTEFARTKFVANGLPAERIVVKPNFLASDPGVGQHQGGYALFVGRLSEEKGVTLLIDAWQKRPACPLKIVGNGPLVERIRSSAGVDYLGHQSRPRVLEIMKDAAFLVFPSQCYETFGLTIIEAFATGLPVIATGHGAIGELVADGVTGRLFPQGRSDAFAELVQWAVDHPAAMADMGRRGRHEYEAKYTAARSYAALIDLYRRAAHLA